jgi:hypothetical protein
MTYIRRRTTKAGSASTALVESYRDDKGRPCQRLLANLHGEPDMVSALAKLELRRGSLLDEWTEYAQTCSEDDDDFVEMVFAAIDDKLAATESEISVIKTHCSATPDEIQAAINAHETALNDSIAIAMGTLFYVDRHEKAHKAAMTKLRRLRS